MRYLVRGLPITAVVAAALCGAVPASAVDVNDLMNHKSGKCMSVEGGGSTANGAHVIQWTCNGGPEQQWHVSGEKWTNGKSGKCLSVANGGSIAVGAHIIQWTCNGGPEQEWQVSYILGTPYIALINRKSRLYLSVDGGGSTANGAHLVQWAYNTGPEQEWIF